MSETTMTPEDSGSGTLTVGQAANAFEGLMDTPANSDEQLAGEQLTEEQAQEQEAEPQQEEEVVDDWSKLIDESEA